MEAELVAAARETVKSLNTAELIREGFIPLDTRYFPAILYPPKTMYAPMNEEQFFDGYLAAPENPVVVYAHIPFCASRCPYCHFVTRPGVSDAEKDLYLDAIEKEADLFLARLGLKTVPVQSISVGGGTPTCLTPAQLERFLKSLTKRLAFSPRTQFTYDVDPLTIGGPAGLERLKILRSYGVDRLTIGAQCFNDATLKRMGRPHTSADTVAAIAQARSAGFESLCLDMMYGYPGQTAGEWAETMRTAVSLGVESYQLYRLRVVPYGQVPGDIFSQYEKDPGAFPALEEISVMKQLGLMVSEAHGYSDRLMTRVFTKTRKDLGLYNDDQCNRLFDVLGLGVGATSSLRGRFGMKTASSRVYQDLVGAGQIPFAEGKIKTEEDETRRRLLMALKNSGRSVKKSWQGRGTAGLQECFKRRIAGLKKFGLLEEDADKITLTEKGRFFADEAAIQFYGPEYIPFPAAAYAGGELNPHRQ